MKKIIVCSISIVVVLVSLTTVVFATEFPASYQKYLINNSTEGVKELSPKDSLFPWFEQNLNGRYRFFGFGSHEQTHPEYKKEMTNVMVVEKFDSSILTLLEEIGIPINSEGVIRFFYANSNVILTEYVIFKIHVQQCQAQLTIKNGEVEQTDQPWISAAGSKCEIIDKIEEEYRIIRDVITQINAKYPIMTTKVDELTEDITNLLLEQKLIPDE